MNIDTTYIEYRRSVNDIDGSIYLSRGHLYPTTCSLSLAIKLTRPFAWSINLGPQHWQSVDYKMCFKKVRYDMQSMTNCTSGQTGYKHILYLYLLLRHVWLTQCRAHNKAASSDSLKYIISLKYAGQNLPQSRRHYICIAMRSTQDIPNTQLEAQSSRHQMCSVKSWQQLSFTYLFIYLFIYLHIYIYLWNRVADIAAGLRAKVRGLNPARGDFSILQNAQPESGAQPACYSMATEVLFRQQCGRNVKLSIRLHLAPMLRTGRATSPPSTCSHGIDMVFIYWWRLLGMVSTYRNVLRRMW